MTTPLNTEEFFNDIVRFIEDSRALLKEGAMMELGGLDARIQVLCQQVLQLTGQERVVYAERLQKLFDDLEALNNEMVVQRETLADELRHMIHHRKASVAYRTTDASDDFGEREDDS